MKLGSNRDCIVVDAYIGESKEKGTPFFSITFENLDGEIISQNFYLTQKTADNNLKLLNDLGFKGKKLEDLARTDLPIEDLFGDPADEVEIVVEEEFYVGSDGTEKVKKVVKWVNIGGGNGHAKLDFQTASKKFKATKFNSILLSIRKTDNNNVQNERPQEQNQEQNQEQEPRQDPAPQQEEDPAPSRQSRGRRPSRGSRQQAQQKQDDMYTPKDVSQYDADDIPF